MKRIHGLALGSIALLTLASCDAGLAPTGTTATVVGALEAAPVDTTHAFAVGLCIGPLSDGDAGGVGTCARGTSETCTGTLIAPNLVLTARHCVEFPTVNSPLTLCTDNAQNFFDPASLAAVSDVRVTLDPSVRVGAPRWHTVAAIALPTGTRACDDDVALLRLTDAIAAADAAPAAADIYTDLAVQNPGHVAIVGRGAIAETYDPDGGAPLVYDNGDYTRRILTGIPVLCVSDTDAVCHISDYTIQLPPNGFDLTRGVFTLGGPSAHGGDSGAGVLDQARFAAGRPTVVGVLSYEGIDATGHSDASFAVRLTQHHDLLSTTATAAATAGGYPVPAWVTAAPVLDAGTDAGGADASDAPDAGGSTDAGGSADVASGHDASVAVDAGHDDGHTSGGCECSTAPTRGAPAHAGLLATALALAIGLAGARRRRR